MKLIFYLIGWRPPCVATSHLKEEDWKRRHGDRGTDFRDVLVEFHDESSISICPEIMILQIK